MGMSEFVVVDASLAFKWLVEEEHSDKGTALTRLWFEGGHGDGQRWKDSLGLCSRRDYVH